MNIHCRNIGKSSIGTINILKNVLLIEEWFSDSALDSPIVKKCAKTKIIQPIQNQNLKNIL